VNSYKHTNKLTVASDDIRDSVDEEEEKQGESDGAMPMEAAAAAVWAISRYDFQAESEEEMSLQVRVDRPTTNLLLEGLMNDRWMDGWLSLAVLLLSLREYSTYL
jgi:hypothetical protein